MSTGDLTEKHGLQEIKFCKKKDTYQLKNSSKRFIPYKGQRANYIESSKPFCIACQLTGFYMRSKISKTGIRTVVDVTKTTVAYSKSLEIILLHPSQGFATFYILPLHLAGLPLYFDNEYREGGLKGLAHVSEPFLKKLRQFLNRI